MAAAQPPPAQGEICPDPTAHGHIPQRLQDQASKAALYVTQSERDTHPEPEQFSALGSDGKLSSAGGFIFIRLTEISFHDVSSPLRLDRRSHFPETRESTGSPFFPHRRHRHYHFR